MVGHGLDCTVTPLTVKVSKPMSVSPTPGEVDIFIPDLHIDTLKANPGISKRYSAIGGSIGG
ncbi:hypothetical protein BMW22_07640 [Rhizobium leguminosarum]|uniref:Uncharacterized protein n=1 Tax=Rhizobium leguminosarum TaxID=384 RepID=A0A1L3Z763_RHILE|nr:hypothetical protein BMW22_07640 [Rhizobium leguminosarum]